MPSAEARKESVAKHPEWHVQTQDGKEYGPIHRHELDAWVADGRIDASCQILHDGWNEWRWAKDVFPQLAKQIAERTQPMMPCNDIPITVDAGMDIGAGGTSLHTRHRQYPALTTISTIYTAMAWIAGASGLLVACLLAMAFFHGGFKDIVGGDLNTTTSVISILTFVLTEGFVLLYTFVVVVTLLAAAELIKLALNLEHDNHITADALRKTVELLANRK